jgi:hypothetical protein
MPLDTLTSKLAPLTMDVLGETINARYYWQRISGADIEMYLNLTDELRTADAVEALRIVRRCCAFLARVIADWDFLMTAGGPTVPLTEDGLYALGPEVVGAVFRAFFAGMRLGEPTGNDLPAPLPPTPTGRSRKSSRAS